jgi:hypothetical protein
MQINKRAQALPVALRQNAPSKEHRGADREYRGGTGTRFQGRVEIELNVGRQPQTFEECVIVI